MIALSGVSNTERGWLVDQLATSYRMRAKVEITDLNGNQKSDVSNRLIDGQVNIDAEADVTRTASLTLFDPQRNLSFDPDSASDVSLFFQNMVRITYGVFVERMNRWVDIPLFYGPVVALKRDDNTVNVECAGKETLAMDELLRSYSRKKGLDRVELIKDVMRDCAGETSFNMPNLNGKADALNIKGDVTPWAAVTKLAKETGRNLFYDGTGTLVLRSFSKSPVFTFRDGDDGTVLSNPTIDYDISEAINAVEVTGVKKNFTITGLAVAGAGHPLSPNALGRNGAPRYLVERIEAKLDNQKEAAQLAERLLEKRLVEALAISFEAMPMPLLEEGDRVRVQTDEIATEFIFNAGSISLVAGNAMSVGTTKRMRLPSRKNVKHRVNSSKKRVKKEKSGKDGKGKSNDRKGKGKK